MGKPLIIVESPAKTRTLKNFLGSGYRIEASMGHVRDLPKSKLGVEVEHDFKPDYRTIPERKDVLAKLKEAAKDAPDVYLASDPDREGEAIAWHLQEALKLKSPKRIEFNEITRSAVEHALAEPRQVDMQRVNAQQARRVLDRLVGYKLSPLLWRKVKKNLSAGRVQSVAVRLICDREREIEAFVPVEYWSIAAKLTPLDELHPFDAKLIQRNGKKIEIGNKEQADAVLSELNGAEYRIKKISRREQKRNAAAPFITSTFQQEAARKLGFSNKRTMAVAQQLYEGIELGQEGAVGLITYMRTDSTRISGEALAEVRQYITDNFGKEYVPAAPRQFSRRKNAQDAHEAIRPTSVLRHPDRISEFLDRDQLRLYKLIWQRFVASQMASAVFDVTTVDIAAQDFTFRATGSVIKFAGFTAVYTEGRDDATIDDEDRPPLPAMSEGQELRLLELIPDQHFTEPPPRYTEATLVKALEENGIGRPSTYAAIISTIQDRRYVMLEQKKFKPTELGFIVTDLLVKHFPDIMSIKFTASIEDKLDDIAEGDLLWVKLLHDFYGPFEKTLEHAAEHMERVKIEPKESDEVCPECGRKMLIRESRFGEFLGCSGYPECKKTMPIQKKVGVQCPACGQGEIIQRMSKKRKVFYGCNRYPECSFVTWDKPIDRRCPKCNSILTERRFKGRLSGYKCSSAECDYTESAKAAKQTDEPEEEALAS